MECEQPPITWLSASQISHYVSPFLSKFLMQNVVILSFLLMRDIKS